MNFSSSRVHWNVLNLSLSPHFELTSLFRNYTSVVGRALTVRVSSHRLRAHLENVSPSVLNLSPSRIVKILRFIPTGSTTSLIVIFLRAEWNGNVRGFSTINPAQPIATAGLLFLINFDIGRVLFRLLFNARRRRRKTILQNIHEHYNIIASVNLFRTYRTPSVYKLPGFFLGGGRAGALFFCGFFIYFFFHYSHRGENLRKKKKMYNTNEFEQRRETKLPIPGQRDARFELASVVRD